MLSKELLLFSFLILFSSATFSQAAEPVVRLTQSLEHLIENENQAITAIAVKSQVPIVASISIDGKVSLLEQDPDAPDFTYFLSLPAPDGIGRLEITVSDQNAVVYLINSGPPPEINLTKNSRLDDACDEAPRFISQSEWRSGLDEPNYNRSFHEVEHIIVHHSAGSNSATNYAQVVRDIYLYHTQVNGWSDIGYNYLISQDGTLYAGRDPGTGEQSLVRGAHFCGANTETMGVCLLGNFETAEPTEEGLIKLNELLTYETITLDLDPLEERQHRLGLIGRIAGHQDGCATLCPGANVYEQLTQIRSEVYNAKVLCEGGKLLDFAFDHEILGVGQVLSLTNQSRGYNRYEWWIDGYSYESEKSTHIFNIPGSYDLGIIGFSPDQNDTLLFANAVKVSRLYQEPIIFPNPNASRTITIDYRPEIKQIILRDLQGRIRHQQEYIGATIQLPSYIRRGVYQLELITTEGSSKASKLVLQ